MDRCGSESWSCHLSPIDNLAQEPRFSYLYNGMVVTSERAVDSLCTRFTVYCLAHDRASQRLVSQLRWAWSPGLLMAKLKDTLHDNLFWGSYSKVCVCTVLE